MDAHDHCCRLCIGIVEDETALIKVYEKAFERKGIRVCFIAEDGAEAVEKFRRCQVKPDVILMDNRLPRMSGIEAMKALLKTDPGIRVIFLSGDADARDEAIKAGAYLFLKKPASLHDLIGAIHHATSRHAVVPARG